MNKLLLHCFPVFLLILVISCHKDSDTNSPAITLVRPAQGAVYNVYDTIWISALISDESKLESVKVSLLDKDQKPILVPQMFTPSTSEYTLNTGIPIDDIHLETGTYSLQVKAFDGFNYTNAYKEILIREIPLKLKSVVLLSRGGIYSIDISILSESGTWNKIFFLNGDYKASDICSFDQLVFTAGARSGNLNATSLPVGPVVWQVPLLSSPPYRYFEDILYLSPLLYVANYNGSIYGYNRNGTVIYSSNVFPDYFPEKLGFTNNFLLADLHSKTGNVSLLAAYYLATGSYMQSTNLTMDVIAFETVDNDNVLVFGNEGSIGKILEYTISQNKLRVLKVFPDGIIHAIARKDDQNIFIAGNQAVHWYIRPTNTLVEFLPGKQNALIDFDKVNNRLYALSNHNLATYEMFNSTPVLNIPVVDSALALHLLYNK